MSDIAQKLIKENKLQSFKHSDEKPQFRITAILVFVLPLFF